MRIRIYILLSFAFIMTNCASSPPADPYENDPIARAVLKSQKGTPEQESFLNKNNLFQQELEIQRGIEDGDLVVGMKMKDVLSLWGQPRWVETAGSTESRHQRWIYSESVSPRWQIKPNRIVYFENGLVAGWENARSSH
jgi:hypothetical protein